MRLKQVIRAEKVVVDAGKWERQKKMPRKAFPLSKSSSYRIPASWTGWRVVRLSAGGQMLRLLVAFDTRKEEYRGWLGVERGGDLVIVARLEFHGTHPGWHCHANCNDPISLTSGVVKGFGDRRYPKSNASHRNLQFGITELTALAKAFDFFRVSSAAPTGALL